jgi:hypothetical protein
MAYIEHREEVVIVASLPPNGAFDDDIEGLPW